MEYGLAVVDEYVNDLTCGYRPNPDGGVARPGDDHVVAELEAQDRTRVPPESPGALQRRSTPHLDGVVPKTADDLVVVVLEAVNALAGDAVTLDAADGVLARSPIVVDALDVCKDFVEESPVKVVLSVQLPGLRSEKVVDPPLSLCKSLPE